MTEDSWKRMILVALMTIALGANAAFATGAGATTSKGSQKAAAELKAALSQAKKAGSVRVTVHFVSGTKTGEVVEDTSTRSGVETVAIGQERISLPLSKDIAYVSGNASGLASYFGMPSATAYAEAGRWFSLTGADSIFQSVVTGLTLSSALKEVTPGSPLKLGKTSQVNGQSTISIADAGSAGGPRTTLFLTANGRHLPIELAAASGSGKKQQGEIVAFSRWGERVHVPVPTTAVPFSTLTTPATG